MNSLKRKPKTKSKGRAPVASAAGAGDQPRFVGIDLHKRSATFHILSPDGKTLLAGQFDVAHKEIERFAAEQLLPTDSLAVEVTNNTWAFVRLVRPYVASVVVS